MASDKHQWGESGILRGKKPEEDDLLVFGYSCKLFRDDEKALFIDQGKHLIPWMGDESLRIDRYDGRGAISDLRSYEAGASLDYDGYSGLTDAERRVETLCDEERYRALHHVEDDEELYHEEELKRLRMALAGQQKQYGAVQYAYDEDAQRVVQVEHGAGTSKDDDEDDTPFIAPPELDIPLNMVLPNTMKHHAIIERTADFIAKQGGQMEVLLKAKQAGNAQFGFLSFDNELHAYYKLLLTAIRAGRYKPRDPQNNDSDEEDGEDNDEDHYLHPSLALSTRVDCAPAIPSITYRPSANCAYSMLVTQIKGKQATKMPEQPQSEFTDPPPPGLEVTPTPNMPTPRVVSPPQDLQLVIDKMAMYVAKNGPDFEAVVRNKGDPRFSFLDPTHPYYMYYVQRMREFAAQQPVRAQSKHNPDALKTSVAPVSFSIRSQTGDGVLETRSALDETGERPRAGEAYMATALQRVSDVPLPPCPPPEPEMLEPEEQERRQAAAQRSKIAEERLRAKLLAAARERMASASKEKQVQAERKRKVAAFLSRLALEKRQIIKPEPPVIIGPQLPPELQPPPDQDDVKSLPSPSPPPPSPSPPPPPSLSITPPPPPTIGSQDSPPLVLRHVPSPRPNGDRRRRRQSPSPSVSHRHKHQKHRDVTRNHRHRRSSPSRKRRHHSPSERKSHKKRSRPSSPLPSSTRRRRGKKSSSPDSTSSSSESSTSSKNS